LLASVAVLTSIAVLGFLYGYFVGPSKIAYAAAVVLIAWPWALPQILVVVSVTWFVAQRFKRSRHRVRIEPASPAT
jgi:hypothetical protein